MDRVNRDEVMARNEQLIRQHRLLQILERYRFGRTLDELRDDLVDELGLSSLHTRSVRRDLEALQAAGIDLGVHNSQRGRVWKLGPLFRGSHKITASATELISLSLARDLLTPLAGTPFWTGIESFWSKVRESLPDSVWNHYKTFSSDATRHRYAREELREATGGSEDDQSFDLGTPRRRD